MHQAFTSVSRTARCKALAIGALTLGACGGFKPYTIGVDPVLLAPQQTTDGPWAARCEGTVILKSDALSGTFRAAIAGQISPTPRVRIQLFADVGGKVLDLVVDPQRLTGKFGNEAWLDLQLDSPDLPYHPLLFVGWTLLEMFAEPNADRILGYAPSGNRAEVNFRPSMQFDPASGASVVLDLIAAFAIDDYPVDRYADPRLNPVPMMQARRYAFGAASWEERPAYSVISGVDLGPWNVRGSGFELQFTVFERELERNLLPDALFNVGPRRNP